MTHPIALLRNRRYRGTGTVGAAVLAVALPLSLSAALIAVSSVSLRPTTVTAGEQSAGTVTIDAVASGAVPVSLSSSNPSVAQVPASVLVNGRTRTGVFSVSTSGPGCATISAKAGATAPQSAVLFVDPAPPSTISLVQLSLASKQVVGGQSGFGSVILSRTPAGGATVQLSSSSALVKVPESVAVPSANTPVSFTIRTSAVTTATCSLITATFAASPRSALLQVLPSGG